MTRAPAKPPSPAGAHVERTESLMFQDTHALLGAALALALVAVGAWWLGRLHEQRRNRARLAVLRATIARLGLELVERLRAEDADAIDRAIREEGHQ